MYGFLSAVMIISAVLSCSTQKNTTLTRTVHSIKAHYNTYFNGHEAYLAGYEAQKKGNDDNYMEIIPYYMTGNKKTAKLGSGSYDTAIEKAKKAIKQHSITKKPDVSAAKRRTEKGKALLAQREYNPFLHNAWFLLGESQLQQGEFMEAASTFAYIERLFPNKPNIVAKARLLEAQCYSQMEWYFDAERIVNETRRDSFPTKYEAQRAGVMADVLIQQEQFEDAIPNLKASIKSLNSPMEKARAYFLLGQLYQRTGQPEEAFRCYKKVVGKNPPYELEFNARIQQTTVLPQGQSKKMISKLRRMAKNRKNKDYLDQVYYAIGNIYLADGDTMAAIYAYDKGITESTRSTIEKGIVQLHLGRLYWDKEMFVKAQKCYAGALSVYDKEHEDYREINDRSRILDGLLPHASAVELQDSLQRVAQMDSTARMALIDSIIVEVKKKEKEEARKLADAEQTKKTQDARKQNDAVADAREQQRSNEPPKWYFYNPTAVAAGKQEFVSKWGTRELTDDWRRKNKTVLADDSAIDEAETDSLVNDSTLAPGDGGEPAELTEEQKAELEQLAEYEADPHRPEFYLKNLPLTPEKMEASNALLVDGLFNSAVIYKDQMENFPLAVRTFHRVFRDFPEYQKTDEAYYNMFQLYSRIHETDSATYYKELLTSQFPDNPHVPVINDPDFEFKARYGKQVEDSLYQDAYNAYVEANAEADPQLSAEHSRLVVKDADEAIREYPEGDNRPRFMFLRSMSKLNLGDYDQFLSSMKEIVDNYPKSTVSELAGLYVKGIKEGRLLASGKMNNGSIWERRFALGDLDSLAMDTTFTKEKNCNWMFIVAYEHDSINQNQLLYEVAQYNFSNFSVRNFDIDIEAGQGIDLLKVSPFLNYDEAYIYLHKLNNTPKMVKRFEGLHLFIISEDNLKKIMRGLSFADYFDFYDENFDRTGNLKVDDSVLDEPTEILDPDDLYDAQEHQDEEEEFDDEENFIF